MAEHMAPWEVPANEALEFDLPPESADDEAEDALKPSLPWDGHASENEHRGNDDADGIPPPAKKQRKKQSKGKPRGSVIKALKESSSTPPALLQTLRNGDGPATGPPWVEPLLEASAKKDLFALCSKHPASSSKQSRMTDCNLYCLGCREVLCVHCQNEHSKGHDILQVRT
jgi:hypothetical protein